MTTFNFGKNWQTFTDMVTYFAEKHVFTIQRMIPPVVSAGYNEFGFLKYFGDTKCNQ